MDFKPEKKLGFGLMRLPHMDPQNPADIDIEQVKKMVDIFMQRGFTYFDTAWMYNDFASECAVKTCLSDRYPRENYTLATKLHAAFYNTMEERDEIFFKQLEKCGVEYFDYYLIHGVGHGMIKHIDTFDVWNWLVQKKEVGLVRHIGFSFHDTPELLEELLTKHPEMEFVQLQINYLDWESEWINSRRCYEVCEKFGKPVIVMEPVKGGTLAKIPAEAEQLFKDHDPSLSVPSYAIRFAASLPNVMVVLSGMSNIEQVEDNTSFMQDFEPLTEEEKALCFKAGDIINSQITVSCTGCHYCTDGCPKHIAIPEYFSLYNEDMRENLAEKGWTVNFTNYQEVAERHGKASDCIKCGQCESVCPQHLHIIDFLEDVSRHFEH